MKTLLAAAALAITGAVTVQAADIFTCGALGYAMHDGRVELDCAAPVTTHWTKLGGHSSASVSYNDKAEGLHVAVTTQQVMTEKAPVERFQTVLPPAQSVPSSPVAAWYQTMPIHRTDPDPATTYVEKLYKQLMRSTRP